MATCNFCKREFASTPAVYAHLKSCPEYQERRRQKQAARFGQPNLKQERLYGRSISSLRSLSSIPEEDDEQEAPECDVVRQLDNRIAEEERRLKLRGLEDAHAELDRREETRKRAEKEEAERKVKAQQAAHQEQTLARERRLQAQQAQERRAQEEQRRRERRRDTIQSVKNDVLLFWRYSSSIDSALKSEIIREIEAALAPLRVEDMNRDDLVLIATEVRDRLYDQAKQLEAHKRQLKQYGTDYFQRVLREEVDRLDYFERTRIENDIQGEFAGIEGDETNEEIEGLVEEVLERHGLGNEEDFADYDEDDDGDEESDEE